MSDPLTQLNLSALILICLLGAMSPGPSLAVILGVVAQSGTRAAIVASWAHALGVAFWATLSLSGWSYIQTSAPYATHGVTFIGSLYLLSLAYKLGRSAVSTDPPTAQVTQVESCAPPQTPLTSGVAGLLISISNPKLLIFFTTIYPQVLPERVSGALFVLAILIPTLIDGAWYHLVSAVSAKVGLLKAIARQRRLVALVNVSLFLLIALRGLYSVIGT